jgi:S-adenosylmethionine hydrolase
MAPLAAELASARIAPAELGTPCALQPGRLRPARLESDGALHGTVGVVDRYGNLLTTIPRQAIGQIERARVESGGRQIPWVRTYAEGQPGEPVALINSAGMLELAVREGSAAARLNVRAGEPVLIWKQRL